MIHAVPDVLVTSVSWESGEVPLEYFCDRLEDAE